MTDSEPSRSDVLIAVIEDIDMLLKDANRDLEQLNAIARVLRAYKHAGKMTDLHYTVDQERLQRTISKCKHVLLTLHEQRKRAVDLLKE
ncbi:hypothetical protein H7Y63_01460 [Polaromonas sp.]|nr:hypothetical protein [Candidatus Saccharibacteria bacterium]